MKLGWRIRLCLFPISLFLLTAPLASCGPSYPKEKLTESLIALCRREYGIQVQAQLAQTTLGVLVTVPGLVEELLKASGSSGAEGPPPLLVEGKYRQDQFEFHFLIRGEILRATERKRRGPDREESRPLKILDQVSLAMRRVALSTDADLMFYTLIAQDPAPPYFEVVFLGHLDDLKRVQYLDISIGELQRRSRVALRVQPNQVARQTVSLFLQDLTARPLPELLIQHAASRAELANLLPKVLELTLELQGRERQLVLESQRWSIRQVGREEAWVYVPLNSLGEPGAILFVVKIQESRGGLLDIKRLPTSALPHPYRTSGPPEKWEEGFYLEPISLPHFLSEQIARRVATEFEPYVEPPPKETSKRRGMGPKPAEPLKPADKEEVARTLLEQSAYVLKSYRFNDFKSLTVTDAITGTRWEIKAQDLPLYRRRNAPTLQPTSY